MHHHHHAETLVLSYLDLGFIGQGELFTEVIASL